LIQDLANTLEPVETLVSGDLFSSLTGSINGLTAALEGLVAGLLHLVGQLLVAVAALLNRLGIDLENF